MSTSQQLGFAHNSRASNVEHSIGARKDDVDTIAKKEQVSTSSAKEYLRNTKVHALFPEEKMKILSVRKEDELGVAFKLLIDHKILSVPVQGGRKEGYIGFIDILDIVTYVIGAVKDKITDDADFTEILKQAEKLTKATCGTVAGLSGRNPFDPLEDTAPLQAALQIMINTKCQRIPIIDAGGELVTIVTQSHLIAQLNNNIEKFAIKTWTVKELKLGLKDVITVKKTTKTIDAFDLIISKKVSGVGVVDDNGVLLGNISGSDLRKIGARAELVHDLLLPVEEFLKIDSKNGEMPPVIAVSTENTFKEVVDRLKTTKSHRVFVIDADKKPVGVISLVDALQAIIDNL